MAFEIGDFMMALVNIFILLLFIVLGIVVVRFSIKCKTEQKNNKSKAQIYVGNGTFVWILGIIFFYCCVFWLNGELQHSFGNSFVVRLYFYMMIAFTFMKRENKLNQNR